MLKSAYAQCLAFIQRSFNTGTLNLNKEVCNIEWKNECDLYFMFFLICNCFCALKHLDVRGKIYKFNLISIRIVTSHSLNFTVHDYGKVGYGTEVRAKMSHEIELAR